jgi:hypothetical protein
LIHSGSKSVDASVHGWWHNINCDTNYAYVTVVLQEHIRHGGWLNVDRKTEFIKAALPGKSKPRVNVRADCKTSHVRAWRGRIHVDVPGYRNAPGYRKGPRTDPPCSTY